MPELPEVEAARTLLATHCLGNVIASAASHEGGGGPRDGHFDDIVWADDGATAASVAESLRGKKVVGVHRRGKQLWLELDSAPHLLAHFGMTGAFVVKGVAPRQYKAFEVHAADWPPRFTKLELCFDGGARVAFCDPRRLGRLRLRADPERQPPWCDLGADPIHDPPSAAAVRAALAAKGCAVKALLLDQGALVCGVGNWVADEVLFQAGIHPEAKASTLSDAQADALRESMLHVLRTAVAAGADASKFPREWLFHYRWGKGKGSANVPGDGGGPISFLTLGGRTSAVVAGRQWMGQRRPTGKAAAEAKAAPAGAAAPPAKPARKKRARG